MEEGGGGFHMKILKDIYLGDHTITIKSNNKDCRRAEITGVWQGSLSFENRDDKLQIRLHDSYTDVSIDHLAIVLHELGLSESFSKKLEQLKPKT